MGAHTVHCTRSYPHTHTDTLRAKQDPQPRVSGRLPAEAVVSKGPRKEVDPEGCASPRQAGEGTSMRKGRGPKTGCPGERCWPVPARTCSGLREGLWQRLGVGRTQHPDARLGSLGPGHPQGI